MTWFAKLALATKILVVPVVFMIALGIVFGVSLSAIDRQQTAIDQHRAAMDRQQAAVDRHRAKIESLGDTRVDALADIARANNVLTRAHLSLHGLMMTAVNEYDADKINARSKDTNSRLEEVVSAFAALDFSGLGNADLARLRTDAIAHASAYQAAAFAAADMAPLDVGSAGIILDDATRLHDVLAGDVSKLTRGVAGSRVTRADVIETSGGAVNANGDVRQQFLETAALAGGVGLILILLICGQVIGRIAGLGRSMTALAEKNDDLDKTISRQRHEIERLQKTAGKDGKASAEVEHGPSPAKKGGADKAPQSGRLEPKLTADTGAGSGSPAQEKSAPAAAIPLFGGERTDISDPVQVEVRASEEAFQGLVDAALKNHEVVEFISEIAEQANLRALNATLEAARDGDTGQRYAALAAEARNLAEQASTEIGDDNPQVADMKSATGDTVEAARSITGIITRIRDISETMAGAWQPGHSYEDIAKAASETGDAAREVLEVAIDLSEHAQTLNDQVESRLAEGRAA